jgi:hypothetical protein
MLRRELIARSDSRVRVARGFAQCRTEVVRAALVMAFLVVFPISLRLDSALTT